MMKNLMFGDLYLYYEDYGTGYPVILIHGLGSDHNVWTGLSPFLKEEYRIIALDLRGHGLSTKTPGPYSMELFSNDIYQFLESLDINQAHFIGHSMGGSILLEMALTHPDKIQSLTLISSFAYIDHHLKNVFMRLNTILSNDGYDAFFDACLELTYTSKFLKRNEDSFKEIKELTMKTSSISSLKNTINACLKVNMIDSLGSVKIPARVIAGGTDHFTPLYHAQRIKNAISQSKIEIIDTLGHNLLVENAEGTAYIIRKFLDGL